MPTPLPNKVIPELTDAELSTIITERENDPEPAIQQIVRGCWREIESRNGLPSDMA